MRNASRQFWALFALQLVCWTLIPAFFQPNAPLDVIEGFAWGTEWPLGTYKHPPLQAWMLEIARIIFGTAPIGYFLLSALCTAIALWAVYRTGILLTANKTKALVAAALAQTIFYFNFLSPEFNPNVLQLLFWALGGWAFAHALLRGKMKHWLLLGAIFALGLYAKYTMAILGFSFVLFMLSQRDALAHLKKPGPYMALLLCAGLFTPHALWLIAHDFQPFSYAASRAEQAKTLGENLWFPAKFLLSQLVCLIPALITAAMLILPPKREKHWLSFFTDLFSRREMRDALLGWLAFGPLLIVVLVSLFTGEKLRDMWGMPFLSFIPLWLVGKFKLHPRWKAFGATWGFFFVITLAAFAINLALAPQWGFKPLRGHFAGKELSEKIHALWAEKTKAPLGYVIGDAWVAGNTAFYHPAGTPRPHVWIDGSPATSPWIDPQRVKQAGAVLVWKGKETPGWLKEFPRARRASGFALPWQAATQEPATPIGWAWLPPETTDR